MQAETDIIIKRIRKKSSKAKKVVFVSGSFNIIHPGHLRLLRFAKECGDYLVVAVLDNTFPGSFVDEKLRLESIQAIAWVDYSFILRDTVNNFIDRLRPAFVVKGKEHEERENPEKDILRQYGGKLIFGSGEISFSSVDYEFGMEGTIPIFHKKTNRLSPASQFHFPGSGHDHRQDEQSEDMCFRRCDRG